MAETTDRQLLRRLTIAWDRDDQMDFLAAIVAARHALGLTLQDEDEATEDREVLLANGYTATGEPTNG
jgi:hypothetical protein